MLPKSNEEVCCISGGPLGEVGRLGGGLHGGLYDAAGSTGSSGGAVLEDARFDIGVDEGPYCPDDCTYGGESPSSSPDDCTYGGESFVC